MIWWLPILVLSLGPSIFPGSVYGAKILALFPLPFYSHTHTFLPVLKTLATRGHHITFVSPYPVQSPPANWTNIAIEKGPVESYLATVTDDLQNANRYSYFIIFWQACLEIMELAYKDPGLRQFTESQSLDYDLIITEFFFSHESLAGLGEKHKIPQISVYPHTLSAWAGLLTGNDFLPSHIPDFRTSYSDQMTFLQRLDNTLLTIFELVTGLYYYLPRQEILMNKYIYQNAENTPRLIDLLRELPIHLLDSHHSVGYVRPHQSNTVPVGGLSIMSSAVLPKDLQDIMDNSPQGIIYLSFGSHVPVTSISGRLLEALLESFRKIDLKVLMKWENDTLENKPHNVEVRKWFPQSGILAHKNCKLFITHGGLHSVSEAAHYGVPIIGIPFFSDQLFNTKFAIKAGFGMVALKEEVTPESFLSVLRTVLEDKTYTENARRRSRIVRDRPTSPMNLAIYWIEYALRHEDLGHLRPAASRLSLFQLFLLDVCLLIFTALTLPLIAAYFIFRKCKSYSRTKKTKTKIIEAKRRKTD